MSRIAIIGGHGKVALHLARILSGQGHQVSSLIRKPEQVPDIEATGATAVIADVEHLTTAELADVLRGHDAVVWSAGAGGGNPARTYAVDQDAAIRSMDAAPQAGIRRYIMVSYFTAGTDRVPEDDSFYPYAQAKAAADEYLRGTDLDWTILGPGRLTLEPATGRIETGAAAEKGDISREDVAQVAAAVLDRPDTTGKFIAFNNGPTPIDEALASLR
ncbi:NADH-flavin reductase [Arthrobacter crystallopoietes BAB-32]|uniref:NADH-flavin reductase n=1 Tax=Arthrobacter crystallopoietes BAB-32 TaxID=1246476 RepID=N1V706_9MICC|nr:SDR family oxidoreductase [Arthrobacter crystallopoietes]EMY34038.1 NADH-flavin reductase [Arthrobacter crystallopoietes BAB-32]